jgi:tRNA(Ile)-lysidine synthase
MQPAQEERLCIPFLLKSPKALRRRVIRAALQHRKDISQAHIAQVEALLEGQGNKETHLPAGICVRREYGHLVIFSDNKTNPGPFCYDLPLDTPVYIPALGRHVLAYIKISCATFPINSKEMCTKYFNYDKISKSLQLRSRRPGDRIAVYGVGRKKLKTEFSDRKIPKARRDSIPLLAAGSDILWIMDNCANVPYGRVSCGYEPEPNQGAGQKVLAVEVLDYE